MFTVQGLEGNHLMAVLGILLLVMPKYITDGTYFVRVKLGRPQ